jgi:zinc transport system substrate-binding protein
MKKLLSAAVYIVIIIFLTGVNAGCAGRTAEDNDDGRIGIIVSIQPQSEFAERVGGDKVKVTVMIPPGASPHTYEPTPGQMVEVSRAEIYAKVGTGIEFELAWMDKIINTGREMLVIDCSSGIDLIEDFGDLKNGDEHKDNNPDPHIWLSPGNAAVMAENIYNGLVEIDPENSEYYKKNLDNYKAELEELDKEISRLFSGKENRKIMVYHPTWTYFAEDYGLEQIVIEKEGKEPTAEGIRDLISMAKQYNIKSIFASPEFSTQSAEAIAKEIGAKVILISPLEKDYIENMRNAAQAFAGALE